MYYLTFITKRLQARAMLVKNLPAIDELGAATLIATCKAGILTCNSLTVTNLWLNRRNKRSWCAPLLGCLRRIERRFSWNGRRSRRAALRLALRQRVEDSFRSSSRDGRLQPRATGRRPPASLGSARASRVARCRRAPARIDVANAPTKAFHRRVGRRAGRPATCRIYSHETGEQSLRVPEMVERPSNVADTSTIALNAEDLARAASFTGDSTTGGESEPSITPSVGGEGGQAASSGDEESGPDASYSLPSPPDAAAEQPIAQNSSDLALRNYLQAVGQSPERLSRYFKVAERHAQVAAAASRLGHLRAALQLDSALAAACLSLPRSHRLAALPGRRRSANGQRRLCRHGEEANRKARRAKFTIQLCSYAIFCQRRARK